MGYELELYQLVEEWIDYARQGMAERCDGCRSRFEDLEEEVFGTDYDKLVDDPKAMQYDRVRDALVGIVVGGQCLLIINKVRFCCQAKSLLEIRIYYFLVLRISLPLQLA